MTQFANNRNMVYKTLRLQNKYADLLISFFFAFLACLGSHPTTAEDLNMIRFGRKRLFRAH